MGLMTLYGFMPVDDAPCVLGELATAQTIKAGQLLRLSATSGEFKRASLAATVAWRQHAHAVAAESVATDSGASATNKNILVYVIRPGSVWVGVSAQTAGQTRYGDLADLTVKTTTNDRIQAQAKTLGHIRILGRYPSQNASADVGDKLYFQFTPSVGAGVGGGYLAA
jgi:hypothetical protein